MILRERRPLDMNQMANAGGGERQHWNDAVGKAGEWSVAFVLDHRYKDNARIHVLHDVMLESAGQRCQIDHLIVTPDGPIVVETKNWEGVVIRDAKDAWALVTLRGKVVHVRSPSEQARRAASILGNLLAVNGIDAIVRMAIVLGVSAIPQLTPCETSPGVVPYSAISQWLKDVDEGTYAIGSRRKPMDSLLTSWLIVDAII